MDLFGYRTVKTAVGAAIAMGIAALIGLQFYTAAGIITILSVQNTKRRSVQLALQRFLSCVIALAIATVAFKLIGFTIVAFGIFLFIFIPATVKLKVSEGIVVSSVIVTHLLVEKSISPGLLLNEILLMIVGILVALAVNLYMPSVEKDLKSIQRQIESHFTFVLLMMGQVLRKGKNNHRAAVMDETRALIEEGQRLSFQNLENVFFRDESYYVQYFQMRKRQFEILLELVELFTYIEVTYEQTEMLSQFIEDIGNSIHEENTGEELLEELQLLRGVFREMPLPSTRQEFETRAILLQFVIEIEKFLHIKKEFSNTWSNKSLVEFR